MKVAFYKAKSGDWLDRLISIATLGPYSHCELVFSDGMCFSSSPRDGGTRLKLINFKPDHWDFVEFDIDYKTERGVYRFCKACVGIDYDWWGVLCPFGVLQDEDKWYCSEIITSIMWVWDLMPTRINTGHIQISPNTLYRKIRSG